MPLDEDGYFDRRCPSRECGAPFKVLFDDWRDKVSDAVCYCPICRNDTKAEEYNTPTQVRYIKQVVMAYVQEQIGNALKRDTERFNRRQQPGFVSMKMCYKPGSRPFLMPLRVAELMQQKFVCEKCGCRYASIGAAFFCPACGHNSVIVTFDSTIDAVRKTIEHLPLIRETLAAAASKDTAQDAVRQILESQLAKLVGAFQRFAEAMFAKLPNAAQFQTNKNTFQRLTESGNLWRQAVGEGYKDMLTATEMADLVRLFQQRHLVAHRDGIVDQEYIDKSGDTAYSVGQRLVVQEHAVLKLTELVAKLAEEIRKLVP
jgi:hypothetical protein